MNINTVDGVTTVTLSGVSAGIATVLFVAGVVGGLILVIRKIIYG